MSDENETVIWKKYSVIINSGLVIVTVIFVMVAYCSSKQQGDYYKITTRPFLFIEDVSVVPIDPPHNLYRIRYRIKNAGVMPAKKVKASLTFIGYKKEKHTSKKTIPSAQPNATSVKKDIFAVIDYSEVTEVYSEVYPNETRTVYYRAPAVSKEEMQRTFKAYPDFSIVITYEDIDGKLYHYGTKKHIYAHDFRVVDIGD